MFKFPKLWQPSEARQRAEVAKIFSDNKLEITFSGIAFDLLCGRDPISGAFKVVEATVIDSLGGRRRVEPAAVMSAISGVDVPKNVLDSLRPGQAVDVRYWFKPNYQKEYGDDFGKLVAADDQPSKVKKGGRK